MLLGDVLVFTGLFCLFLIKRADSPSTFAQSQATLDTGLAAVNTLVLLTSSLLVVLAVRAYRERKDQVPARLLVGAAALGATFIGLKAVEYTALLSNGHTADVNDFYMYYFVLTGLHLAHVLLGLCALAAMHWASRHRVDDEADRLVFFEGAACFWHMIDILWLVIFPLLFLVR